MPRKRDADNRLDRLAERLELQAVRLQRQADRLDNQKKRLDEQGERLRQQNQELKALVHRVNTLDTAYHVVQVQTGSMETRLEEVVSRLEAAPDSTEPERAEARNLLEEVREEHRRVRARFGVIGRYEERVRRLEQAIEPKADF
jgi:chromosome segregation ATPase